MLWKRIKSTPTIDSIFKSPWLFLIVSGYLLRIFLMPITGQHDIMFMAWQTHFITEGHTNLYAYLYERFGDVVINHPAVWAPYPYGFYAFTSGWLTLIERLGLVNLTDWSQVWQVAHPARMVFLFKLAYLPFDVLIGYLLYLSGQRERGCLAWALWAWSPIAIYTPFMMGQNDIYATAFVVAGLYSATRSIRSIPRFPSNHPLDKWAMLSVLFLGVGATFKIFPLLLVPVVSLLLTDKWSQRLGLMCLGGSVFVLATLPFLTTPTFIDGVLLNPEGMQLFRESSLFGYSAPLFVVFYAALLIYLSSKAAPTAHREVWAAGLISLLLLFIFVPTPLYWLIWITPLLIAVSRRRGQRLLIVWLVLQLGFSILLLAQHRELGVALPIHLSGEFNVPNLPTATALTHPSLNRALTRLWPLAKSVIVAALGIALWHAVTSFREKDDTAPPSCGSKAFPAIIGPVAVMLLGLALNLYAARHVVSESHWLSWDQLTLSVENPTIVQTSSPKSTTVTGIRLRISNASDPAARLQACLVEQDNFDGPPLACASTGVAQQVENQMLYFLFDSPLSLEPDQVYAFRVHLETPDAIITLPYSTGRPDMHLQSATTTTDGTLDVSMLWPFSVRNALETLIWQNIGRDPVLVLLIIATGVTSALVIAGLYSRQQPPE